MTREKRTQLIRHLQYNRSIGADYLITDEDADEIIKALEQDPCADAISRQAVLDINESHHGQMPNHVNHQIWEEIKALPSVTPVEKVGRWIRITDKTGHFLTWQCDKCGLQHKFSTNYCPDCGRRMQEVE